MTKYFGYLKESYFRKKGNGDHYICDIYTDETVIYGTKQGQNTTLVFSFTKGQKDQIIYLSSSFLEKMSCKVITNGIYLCALIRVDQVSIHLFLYYYLADEDKCSLSNYISSYGVLSSIAYVEMYDTDEGEIKIICGKNKNNNNTYCKSITVEINQQCSTDCTYSPVFHISENIITIPTNKSNNYFCDLGRLSNEMLYCCGGSDLMTCARLNTDFTLINSFNINYSGYLTYLYILTDGSTFYDIFFSNSDNNNLYKYYIYIPTCNTNFNYEIIQYQSINENIINLFTRKTDHDYFIEFKTLPSEYGNLKINDQIIVIGNKYLIENNQILYIISTNDKSVNNFLITFNILINGDFHSENCNLKLTILPCYDSCSKCTKSKQESSSENHYCEENKCKTGFYPSPSSLTNCYNETTKENNWYLDTNSNRYALCDSTCASCSGSSSYCLSCYSSSLKPQNAHLLNNQCVNECPEGKYPLIQTKGYYICTNCYQNCKTCNQSGDINNMQCDSCKDNNIKYNKNCYIQYNSEQKTFYKAENTTEITSCFQLFHNYILENTFTCIDSPPSTGYFLSNSNTGLYTKCHSDCKTCSNKSTTTSTNCLTCNNEDYNLLDGNCLSSCPEGYYSTFLNSIKICKLCYENCMQCNSGEEYDNSKLINMNCLKCKKIIDPNDTNNLIENKIKINSNCFPIIEYTDEKIVFNISIIDNRETQKTCLDYGKAIIQGQYECIDKELNYYYVLNNEENTGIIKKCDESCSSCYEEKDNITQDTNCISCANGYFKTEDSNINCILENLIPENYFKNNSDNIYYKCYSNCKKCDNYFNEIKNNMNCLECIQDYYFVNETKNCYDLNYTKENAYYFLETDKKFYKCYISCSLCNKGKEFDNSKNKDIHNCLKCANNYYPLRYDQNPNNCYNADEMISNGYILVRKYWDICHENCDTCSASPLYDSNNNLISQNCLTCYDNLFFVYNTSDCLNDSILEKGYYLDNNDLKYHKCDIQCKTCEKYSTSLEPKCTKCNIDKEYYLAYNKPSSLCFNNETIDDHYVLSLIKDNITNKIIKIWMPCYKLCNKCIDIGNNTENNCLSCISGYYLINGTMNCINKSYGENNGYYFNQEKEKFYSCDISCITCTDGLKEKNTNCKICNENLGYYNKKGKDISYCYSEDTIEEGYFLNKSNIPFQWEECHEKCALCNYKGNDRNMGCLSCKNNYIEKKYNKSVYLKLSKNNNCIIGCPPNYFLTKELDCVSSCLNNTYEYLVNYTCMDTCPNNFVINQENTGCIFSTFKNNTSISDFKEILYSNISSFINSNEIIELFNYKAMIISAVDINPIEQIKKGISGLDFGDCIEVLKNIYNISENEDLIVIETETKLNQSENKNTDNNKEQINLGKSVKVTIVNIRGNILNMSYCNNDIKIFKYVGDSEEIKIDIAKDYAEKGINVFDPEDKFFNDKCQKHDLDIDIILKDRREDLFQNVSFCEDNCIFSGMNYTLVTAICSCPGDVLQEDDSNNNNDEKDKDNENLNLNNLINSFTSELFNFNFDIIKCSNLVFDPKLLKNNKGFYTFTAMIGVQIGVFIFFMLKKISSIENLMLKISKENNSNPPKLRRIKIKHKTQIDNKNENNDIKEDENYFEGRQQLINRLNKIKNNNNKRNRKRNNYIIKNNIINIILNENIEEKYNKDVEEEQYNKNNIINIKNTADELNISKEIKTKNHCIYKVDKIISSKDELINQKKEKNEDIVIFNSINSEENKPKIESDIKKDIKINKLKNKYAPDFEKYNDMDYNEALDIDKRYFYQMYIAFLFRQHVIFNTFFAEVYLELRAIKISFLFFSFEISFFLNAVFYTDEYISDTYHNNGVLDFFSSLPKSIYSFIVTIILSTLLNMLSNSKKQLSKIIEEKKDNETYLENVEKELNKLKKKLFIYFIIDFILGMFFTYYSSAFCAVYKNSQNFWLIGCFESLAMDFLMPFIICFVLTGLRYISIQKKIKLLYKMYTLVEKIL